MQIALTYHDVAADDGPRSGFEGSGPDHYRLTPERFARHLDAIASVGLEPALATDTGEEGRRVVLTFDDGGRSAATTIGPMLVDRGWRGEFFVTTARIGSSGFVGADEIRDLHAAGHEIGSHSHTHRTLTGLSDPEVRDEWRRSKEALEDLLGAAVAHASVPTGAYSRRVGELAAEAGYRHVFTSEPWLRPRRLGEASVYGRFAVVSNTPPEHVAALCRLSRPTLLREAARWQGLKAAKLALGRRYEPLRVALLSRRGRR